MEKSKRKTRNPQTSNCAPNAASISSLYLFLRSKTKTQYYNVVGDCATQYKYVKNISHMFINAFLLYPKLKCEIGGGRGPGLVLDVMSLPSWHHSLRMHRKVNPVLVARPIAGFRPLNVRRHRFRSWTPSHVSLNE